MGLWLVLWVLPPSKKWVGMFALSRMLLRLTCLCPVPRVSSVALPPKKRQKKEAKSDKSSSKKVPDLLLSLPLRCILCHVYVLSRKMSNLHEPVPD
eukprot:g13906.t1